MFFVFAGWANREQQEVIEYLRTENQVLREKLGKKRILLNDDQRRRLGAKGKILGRKLLEEFGTLFTPDTILRWHRQLVARKWDYSDRKEKQIGRPRIRQVIVDLTVKFVKENSTWGYDRIQGELAKVGYHICDSTVGNILKAHGIEPAPQRKRTGSWATFLKAHWDVMAAIDFTTVEVWTKSGLATLYLLFVMELKTRRVHFAGCTTSPNEDWLKQMARELTNYEKRISQCQEALDHGPRHDILQIISVHLKQRRCEPGTTATAGAEHEFAPREIFRIAEIRVFAQVDSLWQECDAQCHQSIPRALSHRTLPSGLENPRA